MPYFVLILACSNTDLIFEFWNGFKRESCLARYYAMRLNVWMFCNEIKTYARWCAGIVVAYNNAVKYKFPFFTSNVCSSVVHLASRTQISEIAFSKGAVKLKLTGRTSRFASSKKLILDSETALIMMRRVPSSSGAAVDTSLVLVLCATVKTLSWWLCSRLTDCVPPRCCHCGFRQWTQDCKWWEVRSRHAISKCLQQDRRFDQWRSQPLMTASLQWNVFLICWSSVTDGVSCTLYSSPF